MTKSTLLPTPFGGGALLYYFPNFVLFVGDFAFVFIMFSYFAIFLNTNFIKARYNLDRLTLKKRSYSLRDIGGRFRYSHPKNRSLKTEDRI